MQYLSIFFAMLVVLCQTGMATPPDKTNATPYPSYLNGVIVPMVTPYKGGKAQKLDLDALSRFADYLCSTRVSALFAVSGMGQWPHLNLKEKKKVIKTVWNAAKNRKPVLAGIGSSEDFNETFSIIEYAEKLKVDAIVAVTPAYIREKQPEANGIKRIRDQDLLKNYYEKICQSTKLPILLYDPKAEMRPATLSSLKNKCENIIGIKFREKKDFRLFKEMVQAGENKVAIIPGSEKVAFAAMEVGGVGVIGSGANVYPHLLDDLLKAGEKRNWGYAKRFQKQVIEANVLLEKLGGGAQGIKKILNDIIGVKMSVENRGDVFRPETYPNEHRDILNYFRNMNLPVYAP